MINMVMLLQKVKKAFGDARAIKAFQAMKESNELELLLGDALDNLIDIYNVMIEGKDDDSIREVCDSFESTFNNKVLKSLNQISVDIATIRHIKMRKALFGKDNS